jgi:hypothetical protein
MISVIGLLGYVSARAGEKPTKHNRVATITKREIFRMVILDPPFLF